jgi:hypothetical protein
MILGAAFVALDPAGGQYGSIFEGRCAMGDKGGKKDKDKEQKQKATKQSEEAKRKLEKEPKRTS